MLGMSAGSDQVMQRLKHDKKPKLLSITVPKL